MKIQKGIRSNHSDVQAWTLLRRGDVRGLHELFNRYSKQLIQFGLNRSDVDTAKDALQETFMAIWESRSSLGQTDSPGNYLYATYRRKLFKIKSDSYSIDLPDQPTNFTLPAGEPERNTNTTFIKENVKNLSTKQKEIIYLKYYQGMDYDEIGHIMDMNYQSARNLMTRAIKSLRSKMSLLVFFTFFWFMSTNIIFLALYL